MLQSSSENKQELTWGSFEKWADLEKFTQGFWGVVSTQPSNISGTPTQSREPTGPTISPSETSGTSDKQGLIWGSFERWSDLEKFTQGFWDKISAQAGEKIQPVGGSDTGLQLNVISNKELIWGNFETWADLEKFTHGFWDVNLLQSGSSNILGLKFVGFDYRFIRPKFVYPSQPLEPDILYRVYGPVDKFLSPIRHALIFFENLVITPRMQTSEEQSSQQQTQEQSLQQKTQWVYFSLWDEMAKIKNGWWGD